MTTIALAFSGGLDTTFCALWLQEALGADVVTVTVDTGGHTADELSRIEATAKSLGVVAHETIDGKPAVWERFVKRIIQGHVLRGGVYPLSVGCERAVQAEAVIEAATRRGCDAIAHGSTGAGNDQVRFDVAVRALSPDLAIHAPIRELNWSRAQERDWLAARGVEIPEKTVRYSLNEGLFGTTIGGVETHDTWSLPPEAAYTMTVSPEQALDAAEELVIGFDGGLPVSLDGAPLTGVELIEALNVRGRPLGVGRGLHVGDTILGLKGRIAFEAPGPLLLIAAHKELCKLVHTKWQAHWVEQVGSFWGMLLHEGLVYDPVMADLEALLQSANGLVTGEVRMRLYKGSATVVGTRSPHSLFDVGAGTYGEGAAAWTGAEAAGFAKLHGLASSVAARRAGRGPLVGGATSAPVSGAGDEPQAGVAGAAAAGRGRSGA